MNTHDKAEKLHELGHEVAAAALRRSTMLEHPLAEFTSFSGYQPKHYKTGIATGPWIREGQFSIRPRYLAVQVGKHIGPISHAEAGSLGNAGGPAVRQHPLASGGHGLHHSDPSARSFELLKHHLDRPDMWPMIADHFEENGGSRAAAMAHILRQPLVDQLYDNPRADRYHANHLSAVPATWPINMTHDTYYATRDRDHDDLRHILTLGKHQIEVPYEDIEKLKHA